MQSARFLGSLHCEVPQVQPAIRSMPVSAAIRLNPQSAMRKLQHRFRRSNLELRGPKTCLRIGP
eukprot:3905886-Alexandrium_andersonii.AAC.1